MQAVKRNREQFGVELRIVSYKELYGWTMDEIVSVIGRQNNCESVHARRARCRGGQ